ncbi:hypothetical protein KAU32_00845 [bacterium]|nr:hypothetical protein [bacterium]
MIRRSNLISEIEKIALALEELKDQVVFVGGSVVPLYIENPAVSDFRPTKDIDCIIQIQSRMMYYNLEKIMRSKGFENSTNGDDPICRWIYDESLIDVMPTDESILGFTNKWHGKGFNEAEDIEIINGLRIKILPLSFFIAAKIEAHNGRAEDLRISEDFEDVITIIDGQIDLADFGKYFPSDVKEYIKSQFVVFLRRKEFSESIYAHVQSGLERKDRAKEIIAIINTFANS